MTNKYNICIWMNMPSHHQSGFFDALYRNPAIDLKVRYYDLVNSEREKLGWQTSFILKDYEAYIGDNWRDELYSSATPRERIHIIPGIRAPILAEILNEIIKHNIKWVHWSERSGINFANKMRFNYLLIETLFPFFLYLKNYKKYAKLINQYAYGAFAQGILAKTDFIRWGIHHQKIEYLFYSIKQETSSFEPSFSDKISFCYIGELSLRKGTDLLITSFQRLKEAKNYELLLVGNDLGNGKYQKLANQLKIADRIRFVNTVPVSDVPKYIYNSAIFVLPSRFDGWGVVLNEAASFSKPLISTDQCGAAFHLIKNGENGFRVKSSSVSELSKAMQYYIDYPDQIEKHGKRSYEIYQDFTTDKNVERFLYALNKWIKNENNY